VAIHLFSAVFGEIYIDGQDMGYAVAGQTQDFEGQRAGPHNLEIRIGAATEAKQVSVENGSIAYVSFGLKTPIDESGTAPVGTLEVQSTHGLSGEVFIDGVSVGTLVQGGKLTVGKLTAGRHDYLIRGDKRTETASIDIKPDQTFYTVFKPGPPTNLNFTVQ
jgi:hypothetical protein